MDIIDTFTIEYEEYGEKRRKLNKPALRGALLNYARKVDTIEAKFDSVKYDSKEDALPSAVRKKANSWIAKNLGNDWIQFSMQYQLMEVMQELVEELIDDNEEFKELVDEKFSWEEKKDKPKKGDRRDEGNRGGGKGTGGTDKGTTRSKDGKLGNYSNGGGSDKQKERRRHTNGGQDKKDDGFINTIIHGDCSEKLLHIRGNTVDCCVTSPPYWALRDYGDEVLTVFDEDKNCNHDWIRGDNATGAVTYSPYARVCTKCGAWKGQLGHEYHPDLFADHLSEIMDKVGRVLKKKGSLWVNLGETYGGNAGGHQDDSGLTGNDHEGKFDIGDSIRKKSVAMVPERFALRMYQKGWVVRNKVVWAKRVMKQDGSAEGSALPSPTTDRMQEKAAEMMYHFVRMQDYNYETIRTNRDSVAPVVWHLNAGKSSEGHTATFPDKLAERPILATSPVDGVVLDPFAGTGTTCKVAAENNRNYIGIEMSDEYIEVARNRVPDTKQAKLV